MQFDQKFNYDICESDNIVFEEDPLCEDDNDQPIKFDKELYNSANINDKLYHHSRSNSDSENWY